MCAQDQALFTSMATRTTHFSSTTVGTFPVRVFGMFAPRWHTVSCLEWDFTAGVGFDGGIARRCTVRVVPPTF
jgi:hypothetical protein